MKNYLYILFVLTPFISFAQWTVTGGENTTSTNVSTAGSFKSSSNYGLRLSPSSNDAVIQRLTSGNLVLSSGGSSSDVRINFSYGGGNGGLLIFDGGATNHGKFQVNSTGDMNISSYSNNLTFGVDGGTTTLSGPASSGAIQIKTHSGLGGYANRYLRFGWKDNNAVFTPAMSINDDYNVGIGTIQPDMRLSVFSFSQFIARFESGGTQVMNGIRIGRANSYADLVNLANGFGIGAGEGSSSLPLNSQNTSHVYLFIDKTQGNVGIGTTTPGSFKLAVNGKIWAQEVNVAMTNPGPDYVFEKNYNLLPLSELEAYITQNKHLPEVPSAREMEADGLNLKEMNLLLLKKVEELTLHLIEINKSKYELSEQVNTLQIEMKELKTLIDKK